MDVALSEAQSFESDDEKGIVKGYLPPSLQMEQENKHDPVFVSTQTWPMIITEKQSLY